jgi:hypothetical protein
MVKRLKIKGEEGILTQLTELVNTTDRKRGKIHEVFEPSFDWKECRNNKFIEQKLNYIHANPCRAAWDLVADECEYPHSSARFYATGEQGTYAVTNYPELEDVALTK